MTVLITGANRGIGKALFDGYRTRGETVFGTHRAPEEDNMLQLDVIDPASQCALATRLKGQPIDLLVCNAGVNLDRDERLESGYRSQLWEATFAANVTGVFMTVQSLLSNLRLSDHPKIAIIGSQMGSSEIASGGGYIYRASKAAVLNLGRNLAMDLQSEGFGVGVYHPGWVRTDMGGPNAAISMEESADGLMARFDTLGPETTGVFENWDGRPHPY
ncbi:SDR family oxidoreductase [Yoonia litorea]|uniref:NAD(P)-dependent dehydrogenase, short-chain alcohol dehydrogenase family n=1 Tax=Yoonia litorea TaxID=1123755 RepID=A0A1I6N2B3_9RHOB|nr:SDR family oxidoreductase [Yoonia litorea]SFS22037.1 NAD(P)-dependent dehydrogenase, short-chain alcohol dehydrogenase family [Yoonia litorea]